MRDEFTKQWITENAIRIVNRYEPGELTLRALHYQLVAIGMTNDISHYKRVISAMIDARWDGMVDFEAFSDRDREMQGETKFEETIVEEEIEKAKNHIQAWMNYYYKNRWENQPNYVEVFIEKKALEGVFMKKCRQWDVALGACKGYPSLTFLNDTYNRFLEAHNRGKNLIILYFGDYDPSGEDIPRSIADNLLKFAEKDGLDYEFKIDIRHVALNLEQVRKWNLPHAPAKTTDTRTANWDGLGQVELDAVSPERLMVMLEEALQDTFDSELHEELQEIERRERTIYRANLKQYISEL